MTKESSMLQKKLQELEHVLNVKVFSLPAGTQLPELYILDVEQRFLFLKTLLSAETASSSKKPQYRLQQIGKRLSDLETEFYDWNNQNKAVTAPDQLGNVATVSCTESCLDDDGDHTSNEKGSLDQFEEAENVLQSSVEENTPLIKTETETETETVRVLEKKGGLERSGRFLCGVASGVVIGMALMGFMRVSSSGFPYLKHSLCLPPT